MVQRRPQKRPSVRGRDRAGRVAAVHREEAQVEAEDVDEDQAEQEVRDGAEHHDRGHNGGITNARNFGARGQAMKRAEQVADEERQERRRESAAESSRASPRPIMSMTLRG